MIYITYICHRIRDRNIRKYKDAACFNTFQYLNAGCSCKF